MSKQTNSSTEQSRSVPQLRFSEFTEEWEMKKLGEVAEKVNSGKTPLGGESVYTDKGILFIRSQNVNHDKLSFENSTYISEEINNTMKNSVVKANDILLNITGASLGRSCVVPEDFTIGNVNQHVCIIRLNKEINPRFVQPIFSSTKGQNIFNSLQVGGGREGLNFESIKSICISFSTLPEQTKIATFLTAVDEKIQALKKKKSLLEQYKKGVMQRLFSSALGLVGLDDERMNENRKNEEKNPTILKSQKSKFRQKDGSDFPKWEVKRLGEVCHKKSSNISANKIEDNFGDYIIYGASGILKYVDFYEEESDYISIIKDGAGVGRLFYCKGKSSVLGTMEIIKPIEGINTYYLFCLLSNIDFTKYITGSTIPHIYFKDYKNENCSIPSLKEQTLIANFLSAIDDKINIQTQLIASVETWKKGLLQKMFI
jgi:type I restriction enzyme, S subunit